MLAFFNLHLRKRIAVCTSSASSGCHTNDVTVIVVFLSNVHVICVNTRLIARRPHTVASRRIATSRESAYTIGSTYPLPAAADTVSQSSTKRLSLCDCQSIITSHSDVINRPKQQFGPPGRAPTATPCAPRSAPFRIYPSLRLRKLKFLARSIAFEIATDT